MAGALMQLVAYGAQDVYLTGNPQITFFKVVYKRHTNFAMELVQQTLSGSSDFGNTVRCKISRAGDLLHDVWVNVTLPQLTKECGFTGGAVAVDGTNNATVDHMTHLSYCNRVGFRLLKSVELRIGGQQIDRHTSLWMHLWTELSTPSEKKGDHGLNDLVGNKGTHHSVHTHAGATTGGTVETGSSSNPTGISGSGSSQASCSVVTGAQNKCGTGGALELWIPLQFSFCRNPGLALPLIALQYHEVELVFELETFLNCLSSGRQNPRDLQNVPAATVGINQEGSLTSLAVWGNYIFLDTEERKNFAQNPHEYLIETVQEMSTTCSNTRKNYRLNFNHPVKELVWVAQRNNLRSTTAFTDSLTNTVFTGIGAERSLGVSIENARNFTGSHAAADVLLGTSMFRNNTIAAAGTTAAVGLTGNVTGGDSFTDFTTDAKTVHLFATEKGIVIGDVEVSTAGSGFGASLTNVATTLTKADDGVTTLAGTASTNAAGEITSFRITDLGDATFNSDTFKVTEVNGVAPGVGGATGVITLDLPDLTDAGMEVTNTCSQPALCYPGTTSMVTNSVLRLNGQERFAERTSDYFNRVQPYQHHRGNPDLGINSYSFALKPEEHQPSGTCNFSRIDNAELTVETAVAGTLSVFAHGYNVLRVASGMGGLAYSN